MNTRLFIVIALFLSTKIYAELTYIPLAEAKNPIWEADSHFLGLGVVVKEATKDVEIIWKISYPHVLGCLYFMYPSVRDSGRRLRFKFRVF